MATANSLVNHFLIAMPNLGDPNFQRTVTYICEHTSEGAMGIVVNRPLEMNLSEVFEQMGIKEARKYSDIAVHMGGPVQNNRGFVLHAPLGDWESTLPVTDTIGVSTSRDVLLAIAEEKGPKDYLLALGYAGWGAGQLEQEMAQNAWLCGPASTDILFHTPPPARWAAAVRLLGIDVTRLSGETGHA